MDINKIFLEWKMGNIGTDDFIKSLRPILDKEKTKYDNLVIYEEEEISVIRDIIEDYEGREDFGRYFKESLKRHFRKFKSIENNQLVRDYLDKEFTMNVTTSEELFLELKKLFRFLIDKNVKIDNAIFNVICRNAGIKSLIDNLFLSDIDKFRKMVNEKDGYELLLIKFILEREKFKKNDKNYQNEELVERYQEGEEELLETIISNNMGLVDYCVRAFLLVEKPQSFDYEDLRQEGVIALINATRKFDFRRNVNFSTYAVTVIKRNLRRVIDSKDAMIGIPVYLKAKLRELYQLKLRREQELGFSVNLEDLVKAQSNRDIYMSALCVLGEIKSLNEKIYDDSEDTFIDRITSDEMVEEEVIASFDRELVGELLEVLTPRQRQIVELYYGIGQDRDYKEVEVAELLNVHRTNVNALLRVAQKKMFGVLNKKEFLKQ